MDGVWGLCGLLYAFFLWGLISYVDASVKGRYIVYTDLEGGPWNSFGFMADKGVWGSWRANVLGVLAAVGFVAGVLAFGWRAGVHVLTLFPLEHWGYWIWIVLLDIPQRQVFTCLDVRGVTVFRRPRFGEVPANPQWLRIGRVSFVWLHRRPVMVGLVIANTIWGVWHVL